MCSVEGCDSSHNARGMCRYHYMQWYLQHPEVKFRYHKAQARTRGIPFRLTFDEWWEIWQASGHWEERGNRRDQFVMARPFDRGAYEVGNVCIILHSENLKEAKLGKKRWTPWMFGNQNGKNQTPEARRKMSEASKAWWAKRRGEA